MEITSELRIKAKEIIVKLSQTHTRTKNFYDSDLPFFRLMARNQKDVTSWLAEAYTRTAQL